MSADDPELGAELEPEPPELTTELVTVPPLDGDALELPPRPDPAAAAYLANLQSAHSRRNMRGNLDRMAAFLSHGRRNGLTLPWGTLRAIHTQAVRAALVARSYAPATANMHLTALRGVLRCAWVMGLIPADEYNRAVELERIRGERIPPGRALPTRELEKMFEACARDPSPAGRRDAAILALLYQAGLRCCEAVALDAGAYDVAAGSLKVMGKGNKQALAYLDGGGRRALEAWLAGRGSQPGPLLCRILRGGRIYPSSLSSRALAYIVERRATEGGVTDVSPHDLRRSLISDLLDDGVDLATVQRVARHASPATTVRYDRRGERTKREAARRARVPFVEPG